MWNTIQGAVMKSVTEQLLDLGKPNKEPNKGNYNIQGHINNIPINLTVGQSSHGSGAKKASTSSNPSGANRRYPKHAGQNQPACNNSFNAKNNAAGKCKGNKFVVVNVPKNGNFEVDIKKTEAQLAKMSVGGQNNKQKPYQNKQKGYESVPNKKVNVPHKGNDIQNKAKPQYVNKNKPQKISPSGSGYTWVYLGRLKIGTTESDIISYLSETFPGNIFFVESLPLYKDGILPAFKVSVPDDVLETFQQSNHWPDGVKIQKYYNNFKQ